MPPTPARALNRPSPEFRVAYAFVADRKISTVPHHDGFTFKGRTFVGEGRPRAQSEVPSRLAGILMITLASCIGLLYPRTADPGGTDLLPWSILLGFPACVLGAFGVLLLIYGARLREEWRRQCFDASPATPTAPAEADASIDAATTTDARTALASVLALRAIRAAARSETLCERRTPPCAAIANTPATAPSVIEGKS
jgi:hypothetical protein